MDYLVILMVLLPFSWSSGYSSVDMSDRLEQMEKKFAAYDALQQEVVKRLENRVHDLEAQLERTNKTSLPPDIGVRGIQSVTSVAFSAFVDHPFTHIGLEQPVPYNSVITNIGNAFSQHTHVFTCPVTGLYLFTFTICNQDVNHFVAKLVVDNQNIVDAISQPTVQDAEIQGSNTAIIQVDKGKSVWVAVYYHSDVRIQASDGFRFATFSGLLIQTM